MPVKKVLLVLAGAVILGGCAANTSQVKKLNNKELAEYDLALEQARQQFLSGQHDNASCLVEPLCKERTANLPLYQSELGIYYLACNNKQKAKQCLLEAYTSIENFFDATSEKKAVSLWGSEAEKVFKGDPYERSTLSLFLGLLMLEEGDFDNAIACLKNGQMADSDVAEEKYKSDYGLLQFLEAKCYQFRGEEDKYQETKNRAMDSFACTHPYFLNWTANNKPPAQEHSTSQEASQASEEASRTYESQSIKVKQEAYSRCQAYCNPLVKPFNTLLLVWTGRSPEMARSGQYGEKRILIKNPNPEIHFEVQLDSKDWYDEIYGYADITFQATTRGGRMMDDVLASHAAFKQTTQNVGNTMFDAANNTSDPYAKLTLLAIGLVASGVSNSANASADIRCLRSLPDDIGIIPLSLLPGDHAVTVYCYDRNLKLTRSITQTIVVNTKPFQFYNVVVPYIKDAPPEVNELEAKKVVLN